MKEKMEEHEMGEEAWWMHLSEEQKKAFIKAELDFKIKKIQAKLEFMKELQKIFG